MQTNLAGRMPSTGKIMRGRRDVTARGVTSVTQKIAIIAIA